MGRAIEWQRQMPVAPRLCHSDGMVLVDLDGRSVVFPSEAAARFFYEAYLDVPRLTDEVASLRGWMDEGALQSALQRVGVLEAQVAQLLADKEKLQAEVVEQVRQRTVATARATLLAKAIRKVKDAL